MTDSRWQVKLEGVSVVETSGILTIHHFADPISEVGFLDNVFCRDADLHSDSVLHIDISDTYSATTLIATEVI